MADDEFHLDLRVEKTHGSVSIYDKLGGGHIELGMPEAEYVRDKLTEVLDDEDVKKPDLEPQSAFKGGPP